MESSGGLRRLCDLYVKRAWLAGMVYCAVPTVAWFAVVFAVRDFREVYLLRLAIALVAGCAVAALANQFAVNMWVAKHRSSAGPATVFDGLLLGAASGWGTALVPPLTGLIASHGLEATKTLIIAGWLASAAVGAILGAILAVIGRKHLDRGAPAPAAGQQ
jgi:MFS family permease